MRRGLIVNLQIYLITTIRAGKNRRPRRSSGARAWNRRGESSHRLREIEIIGGSVRETRRLGDDWRRSHEAVGWRRISRAIETRVSRGEACERFPWTPVFPADIRANRRSIVSTFRTRPLSIISNFHFLPRRRSSGGSNTCPPITCLINGEQVQRATLMTGACFHSIILP